MECKELVVRVGDKEIEINEDVITILNKYARTEFSLEKLAQELGLSSWDEAYEFVKRVPSWIMWVPAPLWKYVRKKLCQSTT
ncbi:MAG TPA: hypothetical protein ENF75_02160 [Acidilobales archaeon]|nr:MAG: hypothetical protein DRO18_01535 [Thermoprotei archaeon]HDD25875.1 hypothetical protein [Acidilobales archaeon]